MVAHLSEALGESFSAEDPEPILQRLGPLARMIEPGFGNTANPTMLSAGYKVNVIPGAASAMIDGRFVPGGEEELLRGLRDLVGPDATVNVAHRDVALEAPFEVPLVDAMRSALVAEDPAARPVPYLMSGGTDGKAFSRLGVRCYGFAPLQLPADLDFGALFHGVDERVPIDSLRFGVRVLDRFLRSC
jgi:acetylornithine deacetylase/succinyl-diaminopimelate desuccinylase-like protein